MFLSVEAPTAEVVIGSLQDPSGCKEVDRIIHPIGVCLQDAGMGRAHSVFGRGLCAVTDCCHPEVRKYDLPTVQDSAA